MERASSSVVRDEGVAGSNTASDQTTNLVVDFPQLPAAPSELAAPRVHKRVHKRVLRMVKVRQDNNGNYSARKRSPPMSARNTGAATGSALRQSSLPLRASVQTLPNSHFATGRRRSRAVLPQSAPSARAKASRSRHGKHALSQASGTNGSFRSTR
jgi:hypothetical protein